MAQGNPQTKYPEQNILNEVFDRITKTLAVMAWQWNGQTAQPPISESVQTLLDYVGTSNPIYLGLSAPGTATSSPLWQIRKLTFDASGNLTAIKYASVIFDSVWDDRSSLSYA